MDARVDAAPTTIDAGPCVAKGCDELGYECGQVMDNCGNPLNCDQANGLSTCEAPLRCGGDPDKGVFKCGCKPRTDPCAAQGAQCGEIEECGQIVQCGQCANGSCLGANQCACTPNSDPCGGKVCGSASNGCGTTVTCGASAGQCAVGTCGADGQCACRPKAEACAGRSDSFTENGCPYDCGTAACAPDNATACAGAECGTAINNCGDTVACGAAGGACAAGSTCIDPVRVLQSTALPVRSAAYQGGYCAPDSVAKMLGKYAVRSHAFSQARAANMTVMSRLEVVQYATIKYVPGTGGAQITEQGCTAGSTSRPGDTSATASVPNIRNVPAVTSPLAISGSEWKRDDAPNALLGSGQPAGWEPGIPAICAGHLGETISLPASDPRYGKSEWWPDNRCTCPTDANKYQVPQKTGSDGPDNYSETLVSDCRIVDGDMDGYPGVTLSGSAAGNTATVYNVGVGHGVISGAIRDDRYHIGQSGEAVKPPPATSVVVACHPRTGAFRSELCGPPDANCGCPERLQPVQFVPLADEDPLDCNAFGTVGNTNQVNIDARFAVPFGTCTAAGQCPQGALCRGGQCIAATAKSACTYRAVNSDPSSGFTEGCPMGMECRSDTACWPTNDACPATPGTNGELCTTPPTQ